MGDSPTETIDMDDFDSLDAYITAAMEDGFTLDGSDFEGCPCCYCGDLIAFAEIQTDPDALVTWDIRVRDFEAAHDEPYFARHYFCSDACKHDAQHDEAWLRGETDHGEDDRIHEDALEGNR